MSSPFTTLANGVTREQIEAMAKTGQVPSNLKSEDSKMYIVIFACIEEDLMYSNMVSDEKIYGEAIICTGREATYERIISFLIADMETSIDLKRSRVLVEGVDAGKGVSLYRFIQLCKSKYPDKEIDLSRHMEALEEIDGETPTRQATGFGGNSGTLLNQ